MSYSLQKSMAEAVVGFSLSMILVGCSSEQHCGHPIISSRNETYLDAGPLKMLQSPDGIRLPSQIHSYEIPSNDSKSSVGKQLDIRPPLLRPLDPQKNAYVQYKGDNCEDAGG